MIDSRLKYALPRAENLLRIVGDNIIRNLIYTHEAKVEMAPLMQRAYNIVNETGVIPYKDFEADVEFLPEQ
jgi:hypothetical protein